MFPFRRVLVAADCGGVDVDLLSYAAALLARSPQTSVTVAARPQLPAAPKFAALARSMFAARGLRDVSCRYLADPDWEEIHDTARHCSADLLIARAPARIASPGRWFSLPDAPCALWLAPPSTRGCPRRIVASVSLDAAARSVIETAFRVASATGADDVIALHVFSGPVLDPGDDNTERLSEDRRLDLYGLTARIDADGVPCLLEVAESLDPPGKAARFAEQAGAGLVVSTPDSIDLSVSERVAVLMLAGNGRSPSRSWRLKRRRTPLFEPVFN